MSTLTDTQILVIEDEPDLRAGLQHNLELEGYTEITDHGVSTLAQGCPLLACLNLWVCNSVSDAGICLLAAACTQLTSLDLRLCAKVSAESVHAVALTSSMTPSSPTAAKSCKWSRHERSRRRPSSVTLGSQPGWVAEVEVKAMR